MLGASRISYLALSQVLAQEEVVYRAETTITPSGNAQIDTAQSKFGGASAVFDGTDDYLEVSDAEVFGVGTGDFTYECWVRTSSPATMQAVFDARPDSSNGAYPTVFIYQSKFNFYYNDNFRITDSNTVSSNTWYHLAVVRSGSTITMYVNGSSVGTYADSTSNPGHSTFRIGSANTGSYDFNGYVDEFRVSDSARYTSNFTAPTEPFANDNNTLMLLHCDGSDGSTTFIDDNGLTRSAVGVTAFGDAAISIDQNKFGVASAVFDGTDDKLQIAKEQLDFINNDEWTVEGWIRRTNGTGSFQQIFGLWDNNSSANRSLFIGCDSDSTDPEFVVYTYDSNGNIDTSVTSDGGTSIANNTWYHFAVVKDTTNLTLYLNGVSQDSASSTTYRAPQVDYSIGSTIDNALEWNGYIDEVRVSNTARYTSNFTAPTEAFTDDSNTLLLLHMDQYGDGTPFIDDNGQTLPSYAPSYDRPINVTSVNGAYVSTTTSVFGGASYKGVGGKWLEAAMLPPSGDFTIEYRVRIDSRSANSGHWEFANGNHYIKIFSGEVGGTTKNIGVQITDTGGNLILDYASPGGSFPDSAFVFIALSYVASTQTFRVYMNGTQRLNQVVSGFSMPDTTTLKIGSAIVSGSERYARGYIDEFRVSNTARYTGSSLSVPGSAYTNDADTALLLHMDGANLSTVFTDDNS